MIELLARLFIRDSRHTDDPRVRTAYGMLCSAVAITLNILLAAAKFVVGTLAVIETDPASVPTTNLAAASRILSVMATAEQSMP